jgi:ribosomal protein L4
MLPESWLSFKSNILHQAVVSYNDAMNVQTRPRPTKTATANSERKADTPHA